MYKSIALLKAKAGMSRADFIHYYETRHAPLMASLLPHLRGYHRNYIDMKDAFVFAGAAAPDFDSVTELWFEDRAGYEKMVEIVSRPEIAKIIADDEENVFDRSKTRMFVVEERKSPLAKG
jgi:uncharacterized protein (TIGR02118 family)